MAQAQGDGQETMFVWSSSDIRCLSEDARPAHPHLRREDISPPGSLDSRRYPRLDLKLPILYRLVGDDISEAPIAVRPFLLAKSQDVSPIGLCMSLEEAFPIGSLLALTIHLVEPKEKFEALARVVWSRPSGDSIHNLIGLQFVVVDGAHVKEDRHARMEEILRKLEGGVNCQPPNCFVG